MPLSKGSITGRPAYGKGGSGLSIGSRIASRRLITSRMPDGIKIKPEPVVETEPVYKLLAPEGYIFNGGTDIGPVVNYQPTVTTTYPYIDGFQITYIQAGLDPEEPYEFAPYNINNVAAIKFMFNATKSVEYSDFEPGVEDGVQIENNDINKYKIIMPDVVANFTNDANWTTTGTGDDTVYTYNGDNGFVARGYGDAAGSKTNAINDCNNYINGRIYELIMTGTDLFTIQGPVGNDEDGDNTTKHASTKYKIPTA